MPLFGTGGDHVLKRLQEVLHDKRAEGYVDVVVLVLCAVLVLLPWSPKSFRLMKSVIWSP